MLVNSSRNLQTRLCIHAIMLYSLRSYIRSCRYAGLDRISPPPLQPRGLSCMYVPVERG